MPDNRCISASLTLLSISFLISEFVVTRFSDTSNVDLALTIICAISSVRFSTFCSEPRLSSTDPSAKYRRGFPNGHNILFTRLGLTSEGVFKSGVRLSGILAGAIGEFANHALENSPLRPA